MTQKLRQAMNYVVEHVNEISDDDYARFMDDLICNLEVNLSEEPEDLNSLNEKEY